MTLDQIIAQIRDKPSPAPTAQLISFTEERDKQTIDRFYELVMRQYKTGSDETIIILRAWLETLDDEGRKVQRQRREG